MMKDLFIVFVTIFLAAGCRSVKPVNSSPSGQGSPENKSQVTFLDHIVINGQQDQANSQSRSPNGSPSPAGVDLGGSARIEDYSDLQFKYAIILNAPVEDLKNRKLLQFIEDWSGAPYRFGGSDKTGIDCSGFVCQLFSGVYGLSSLPRISSQQYDQTQRIDRDRLEEGDLVFFHTHGKHKTVTHVGVYLCNNKFVHASASGVMISDMGVGYFATHYVGAGRVF
jgi:hypothetical protein